MSEAVCPLCEAVPSIDVPFKCVELGDDQGLICPVCGIVFVVQHDLDDVVPEKQETKDA